MLTMGLEFWITVLTVVLLSVGTVAIGIGVYLGLRFVRAVERLAGVPAERKALFGFRSGLEEKLEAQQALLEGVVERVEGLIQQQRFVEDLVKDKAHATVAGGRVHTSGKGTRNS